MPEGLCVQIRTVVRFVQLLTILSVQDEDGADEVEKRAQSKASCGCGSGSTTGSKSGSNSA